MAAQAFSQSGEAPEWVHLLPAGPAVRTVPGDPRGPFELTDAEAVIAASFERADRLPIDENHAIDFATKHGTPSPARGWILAMEARSDGVWGQVEWTDEGRALVEGKAYRAISPVIGHRDDEGGPIERILRAGLVNNPGLDGLTTLHMESNEMDLMQRLAELLGLDAGADDDAIIAAIEKMKGKGDDVSTMSAQMDAIGKALGCEGGAGHTAILAAASSANQGETVTTLQGQVTALSAELKGMKDAQADKAASTFIDGALKEGRAGLNQANRQTYIDHFKADEVSCKAMVSKMPILGGDSLITTPPQSTTELSARDLADKARAYQADQAKVGRTVDIVAAMAAIQEGGQ
ncbi:MAG: phage protease [Pseudomonadota bacterium]